MRGKRRITKKRLIWAGVLLALLIAILYGRHALHKQSEAIPALGGESFSMAPLSTGYYLQKDPRWENDIIGGSGERLASVGCTVSCLAMAMESYGVKTTPKELNDFLKQNDGYNHRGWLRWKAVSKYSNRKVAMDYIGAATHPRIDGALKSKQPVIVKVFINGIISHWVLIVGKDGNEYMIRDPLGDGKTVERLSKYGSKIYAMRTLRSGE